MIDIFLTGTLGNSIDGQRAERRATLNKLAKNVIIQSLLVVYYSQILYFNMKVGNQCQLINVNDNNL